ncbi:MAG: GNAT family N-acetyltransferase [Thermaceae bacterium]|nr:GNAT family N-acetyltransferase [Thermaceae bacterium]
MKPTAPRAGPGSRFSVRQVTDPHDPAVEAFGHLQQQIYFEPELLIPPQVIRAMLALPAGERGNFLVVAEEGGVLLGGTFFHYLRLPNTGFSSFMGVAPSARGQGIARRLHQQRFAVLDQAAGGKVEGIFIDVVAPERLSPEALEAERRVGSDPLARRRAFAALGFSRVDLRYEQPVGGPGGGPVTHLDLLYCPHQPTEWVPTERVLETLRAYWRPWLGEQRAEQEVEKLRQRAKGARLRLLPAA